jgi:hypothetical protein
MDGFFIHYYNAAGGSTVPGPVLSVVFRRGVRGIIFGVEIARVGGGPSVRPYQLSRNHSVLH